jgi:hypothetical protein
MLTWSSPMPERTASFVSVLYSYRRVLSSSVARRRYSPAYPRPFLNRIHRYSMDRFRSLRGTKDMGLAGSVMVSLVLRLADLVIIPYPRRRVPVPLQVFCPGKCRACRSFLFCFGDIEYFRICMQFALKQFNPGHFSENWS